MAQSILLKRSSVAGNVPGSSDLSLGEIAINTADGAVYIKKGNNDIVAVADNDILHINTSNSRVGIGTTSPSGILHVVGSSAIIDTADGSGLTINRPGNSAHLHLFPAYSSVPTIMGDGAGGLHLGYNSNTNGIRIDTNNKVGIGATSPNGLLHIGDSNAEGSSANPALQIGGANTYRLGFYTDSEGGIIQNLNGDNGLQFRVKTAGEVIRIMPSGNVGIGTTSPGALLDVNNENAISRIRMSRGGTNLSASTDIGFLDFYADYNSSPTHYGGVKVYSNNLSGLRGSLDLLVKSTSGNVLTGMTVYGTSSGVNVGIGTTSPATPLEVKSTGNTAIRISTDGDATDKPQLQLFRNAGAYSQIHYEADGGGNAGLHITDFRNDSNSHIIFNTSGDNERMRIESDGKVGIGTTAPGYRLEVAEDTDGTANLLFLRNSDTTYAQTWAFQSDTAKDLVITGSSGSGGIKLVPGSRGVTISNKLTINDYTFPTSDGSANQVLQTDGSGNLTFATVSGGSGTITGVSNMADNRVITAQGSTTINAESNLTFDGSTLDVTGGITGSGNVAIDTDTFVVSASNDRVGINVGTPLATLDIDGDVYVRTGHTLFADIVRPYATTEIIIGQGTNDVARFTGSIKIGTTTIVDSSRNLTNIGTISSGAITSSGNITTTNGLFQANEGNQKVRQYEIGSSAGTQTFLLGKIENGANADGGVTGTVKAAYDYGETVNNCNIHFTFAQRSGAARGHWWYENTDDDASTDVVSVRLVDDGAGGMFVWLYVGDYVHCFVEAVWRQCSSVTNSGTLSAGTITTGTTLFDTANDPTSEHHIGRLYAHNDIYVLDNKKVYYGNSNDLQIYHDSTDSLIRNYTGDLVIQNDANDKDIIFRSDDGSGGVTPYFKLDGANTYTSVFKNFLFQDNVRADFGNSSDLQIYHDGSNSYIKDAGTGNLNIQTNGVGVVISDTSASDLAVFNAGNGIVTLYKSGSPKLATKSDGVDITGELQADTLDIDGNADISGNLVLGGDLTVNGSTTTLNTATLDVEDLNITVAKGATNNAAANGAGLTVDCGSDTDTTFTFNGTSAQWETNTELVIKPRHTSGTPPTLTLSDLNNQFQSGIASSGHLTMRAGGSGNQYWQNDSTYLMMLTDTGDLSIGNGTTAPTNHRVHIKTAVDNSVAQGLVIERSANTDRGYINYNGGGFQFRSTVGDPIVFGETDAEHMRILPDGNVGIGTASPSAQLHVDGSTGILINDSGTASQTQTKLLPINSSGNSLLKVKGGNYVHTVAYETSWNDFEYARLVSSYNTSDSRFDLKKSASDGSVAATTRISTGTSYFNGNVGIGTTAPASKLSTVGTIRSEGFTTITGGGAGTEIRYDSSAGWGGILAYDRSNSAYKELRVEGSIIKFKESGTDVMTIDGNNVGIGDTTPDFKLAVRTPAIPSGSTYAWPLDLSRPNTDSRGLTFGVAAAGTTNAIAGHNADVSIGHTYGTDSNGLPQYYETLRVKHVDQNSGYIGIGETNPVHRVEAKGTDAAFIAHYNAQSRGGFAALSGQRVAFLSTSTNDDLVFGKAANPVASSGFTEYMRIDNGTGYVGIGTTSPGTKLHVYENVNRTSIKVQNNNHSAIFEAYGTATAIDSDASNGIFLRISGSNKVHLDNNGNFGVGKVDPSAKFQVEEYGIDTTSTSSSATTQIAIHSFAAATFRSARFTVQVTNSTDSTYHTTELLLVHDGTTANITEFGEIHTGSAVEATFDCDVNSGNVRLLATPASTDTMAFKVVCHSITT